MRYYNDKDGDYADENDDGDNDDDNDDDDDDDDDENGDNNGDAADDSGEVGSNIDHLTYAVATFAAIAAADDENKMMMRISIIKVIVKDRTQNNHQKDQILRLIVIRHLI